MTEKVKYLSPEWRDEAEKRLQSEITPDKMNYITVSSSYIYQNCPGGREPYLLFRYVEGKLTELTLGEGECPEANFKIYGEYDTISKITRGELGSLKALMTGKLRLKGNMVKALKLASVADKVNKVLSTIPAEY
jgi:putative sterol carrier protein